MHIGVGGRTDIAHTTGTGIGGNGQRRDSSHHRIELVADIIIIGMGSRRSEKGQQEAGIFESLVHHGIE